MMLLQWEGRGGGTGWNLEGQRWRSKRSGVGGPLDWMFACSICLAAWELTCKVGACVVKEAAQILYEREIGHWCWR
jgi:hypothetical protein